MAAASTIDWSHVETEALELFRSLLRFDTTNPPGNEKPCAEFLADELRKDGLEPVVLESTPGRSNVVTRLKGNGTKPPLLLNAHLDVVYADPASWKHPPFAGEIHDGVLWGRGALDMKNMAAMCATVMRLFKRTGLVPDRDLIFAAVADEENGCTWGSEWLVANHPDLVRAEFALGEVGGFTLQVGKVVYLPVMVAHKGVVWGRLKATGTPGHGSMPREDTAVEKLTQAVHTLCTHRLPQHECKPVRAMVEAMAAAQPFPNSVVLPGLLNPMLAPHILKLLPNPGTRRAFAALLSNTVSPTVLRAGHQTNVIPGEATAEFDGRTLPGQTPEDLLREVRALVGDAVTVESFDTAPPAEASVDSDLFRSLCDSVRAMDPTLVPVPNVMPGYTDARAYMKLGTQHYGFAPVKFGPTFDAAFSDLFHGHDERIPVEGFHWGTRLLWEAVTRFTNAR